MQRPIEPRALSPAEVAQIRRFWAGGVSKARIAVACRVTVQTVALAAEGTRWGLKPLTRQLRPVVYRGADSPVVKWPERLVRQIRAEYVPGEMGYRMLAQRFGMPRNTVKAIVRREIWKHLDAE